MKICIWWQVNDQAWGGGHQFLRRLSQELARTGHQVTHDPNQHADVVLMNAFARGPGPLLRPGMAAQLRQTGRVDEWSKYLPAWPWLLLPRRGPPLVHRVDGVPMVARGFRTSADRLQAGLNRLSDHTVFQSRYCEDLCAKYGVCPRSSSVVVNGVEPEVYYPAERPSQLGGALKLFASSWSANPRKGFARLAEIARLPGVEVYFAGRWCESIDAASVRLLGVKPSGELAEVMRGMDAMVHAGENECCSNSIVEALACGLPVLFLDSGGNRELAGEYGIALTDNSAADVEQMRSRYNELRGKVLDNRERFLIRHVASQYAEAFQRVVDS